MANRLFSKQLASLGKGLLPQSRKFSNRGWRNNNLVEAILFSHFGRTTDGTIWPDQQLGGLGPVDSRLTLPGDIGLDVAVLPRTKSEEERVIADQKLWENEDKFWRGFSDAPTNHQRQIDLLKMDEDIEKIQFEEQEALRKAMEGIKSDTLECVATTCPDLLRKELATLFLSVNLMQGPLTVITFTHRTKNDMSAWSPDVEDEREMLTEQFINAAKNMCGELRNRGQWADFIEPTSGRPYYSPYTNATMFETDDRYRWLGFNIQDLGCCKVISHHKWGTHSFVGSIFTTVPHDAEFLVQIVDKANTDVQTAHI